MSWLIEGIKEGFRTTFQKEEKKMKKEENKDKIQAMPVPPMPPKIPEPTEEELLAQLESVRKKKEEEAKAQEEPKYTLTVCKECGAVYGRMI